MQFCYLQHNLKPSGSQRAEELTPLQGFLACHAHNSEVGRSSFWWQNFSVSSSSCSGWVRPCSTSCPRQGRAHHRDRLRFQNHKLSAFLFSTLDCGGRVRRQYFSIWLSAPVPKKRGWRILLQKEWWGLGRCLSLQLGTRAVVHLSLLQEEIDDRKDHSASF